MKKKQKALLIIGLILLVSAIAAPFIIKAHKEAQRNACLNHLRQLYEPMRCCVPMVYRLSEGDPLDPKIIAQYIKSHKIPKCPSGCEYEIVWVVGGPPPKCPYHGDLIGTNAVYGH